MRENTFRQLDNASADDGDESEQFAISEKVLHARRPFHVPTVDKGEQT